MRMETLMELINKEFNDHEHQSKRKKMKKYVYKIDTSVIGISSHKRMTIYPPTNHLLGLLIKER